MRFPIYFVLFFITNAVFSQNNSILTDKEYLEWQAKARLLMNSDVDSAFIYVNRIQKSHNNAHIAFALGAKSYLYQLKGDASKSKQLYKLAFQYLSKVPSSNDKIKLNAYILSFGGLAEWKRRNLNNALSLYNQGKKLSEKIEDVVQIIKFNNNISSIYSDSGNYRMAIAIARQSDKLTDENVYLYEKEKYNQSKTTVNYKLGSFYESEFFVNEKNLLLIDSAVYYYKQTLAYSNSTISNNISAKLNLGKIYSYKNDFKQAERIYLGLLKSNKGNLTSDNFKYLNVNLGELYFRQKKYNEALLCFRRVDSAHAVNNNSNVVYNYSNYYQAKIYNLLNDNQKALAHSKIFLENYKKTEAKETEEIISVNFKIGQEASSKEMIAIERNNKRKVWLEHIFQGFLVIAFMLLIGFLIRNILQKKKANLKATQLIEEFKIQIENNKLMSESKITTVTPKRESVSLSIDEEKENEIVKKLKELEDKMVFLNQDYTQQYVAKKIKTNTSYLSYVVNKRFGKSFSEYANELKINYVINQLITNSTYRKYSTQAIAESAGYKKANSFTMSFKKRTGVTPAQFVEKIES